MSNPSSNHVDANALAAKDKHLASLLVMAKKGLLKTVVARFEDAVGHARNSITKTAKDAAEGKATVAAVRRNRSVTAARERLLEIGDEIARTVQASRRVFFTDCFEGWRAVLPARVLRPEKRPTQAMIYGVLGELSHGRAVEDDCKVLVVRAADELVRTLIQIASRGVSKPEQVDLLDQWVNQWSPKISNQAVGLLDDAAYRADYLSGRAVIQPKYLHPDPTVPWE